MDIIHNIEHFKKALRILRLHQKYANNLRSYEKDKFNDIEFRPGRARDLKAIEQLHLRTFRIPLLNFLRWVYRFKAMELVSVACDKEGRIIAYDLFMFEESEISEKILHELYVAVDPEYQDKGIATALRRYSVRAYAQKRTLKGLSTLARPHDIKALRTAQSAGYAITKAAAKPYAYYLYQAL
mgnify:CR=1 FL=1